MKLTITLLAAILTSGCSGHSWNLDEPFRLQIEDTALPHPKLFQQEFEDAIAQLGGSISPSATQVVHVWWNPQCSCLGCRPTTTATTDRYSTDAHFDGFQVCSRSFQIPDGVELAVADVVHHELGHVLRYAPHLPAATGAMMSPLYCDRTEHRLYQTADLDAICSTGLVWGGVCLRRRVVGLGGSP